MEEKTGDKIFVEKKEKIRLIIEQKIGFVKFLDQIEKRFKVIIFKDKTEDEKILLIEEQNDKEA